jgi:hypothetical protein
MKIKFIIFVSVLFLGAIAIAFILPSSLLAGHSFWYGTDMNAEGGPFLVNPITRPGIWNPNNARILAEEIADYMPTMFELLVFTNNPEGDEGTTIWNEEKTWDGYTLLTLLQGTKLDNPMGPTYGAVLVDMDGTLINKWQLMGLSQMLPNGSVMGAKGFSQELVAWPYLVQQDWCGNDEWVWKGAVEDAWQATTDWINAFGGGPQDNSRCGVYDDGMYSLDNLLGCNEAVEAGDWLVSGFHHDYKREGNPVGYYFPGAERTKVRNGKTLILSHYVPPIEETNCATPDDPNCISNYRLYDDAIYVVDWQGNIEFKWFAYEHFNQMGFSPKAREAIRETHRANNNENATDYQHFNNVNWVGQNKHWNAGDRRFNPEYIIWDARSSNITAIIATSDHPKGDWAKGDIVWKIGPTYQVPNDREFKLGQIIGQHMAHMIPKGLPGAGNMLLFDNGGGAGWGPLFEGAPILYDETAPYIDLDTGNAHPDRSAMNNTMNNFSRVIEFNPVTLDIVWQYAQTKATADHNDDGDISGNDRLFYSFFISGAQRLKNGNTLITEGATGRIFEVTPNNEVVWEYINPFPVAGGAGIPTMVGTVYRAYRVPYGWAPKDKTCPEP